MANELVPDNVKGKKNDVEANRRLQNRNEARKVFVRACKRLLNPKVWSELAGNEKAQFTLVDNNGKILRRLLRQNDFIRIDVPGPGPGKGKGYDWVAVDLVEDQRNRNAPAESFGILLKACADPTAANEGTAHFFEKGASSSFQIIRNDNTLSATYHGRNEKINNHTDSAGDNIRNTLIGLGAMLGLSELQWSALMNGFLQDEIGG